MKNGWLEDDPFFLGRPYFQGLFVYPFFRGLSLNLWLQISPMDKNNETLKVKIDDESRNPQSCGQKHNHLEILNIFHSDLTLLQFFSGLQELQTNPPLVHVQKKSAKVKQGLLLTITRGLAPQSEKSLLLWFGTFNLRLGPTVHGRSLPWCTDVAIL